MDVRSLELFLAVSEKQSISKAAQENYVSRQALTEAMNRLEDELDVQLFVRWLQDEARFFQRHSSVPIS